MCKFCICIATKRLVISLLLDCFLTKELKKRICLCITTQYCEMLEKFAPSMLRLYHIILRVFAVVTTHLVNIWPSLTTHPVPHQAVMSYMKYMFCIIWIKPGMTAIRRMTALAYATLEILWGMWKLQVQGICLWNIMVLIKLEMRSKSSPIQFFNTTYSDLVKLRKFRILGSTLLLMRTRVIPISVTCTTLVDGLDFTFGHTFDISRYKLNFLPTGCIPVSKKNNIERVMVVGGEVFHCNIWKR